MKWVKANERLGKFYDSDIPDWKFWHPGFCKVDGKPAEGGFFRKDITKKSICFSYVYIPGSQFREEIEEKNFDRIQWLDESESPSHGSAQVLVDALEKMVKLWDGDYCIEHCQFEHFNGIAAQALSQYRSELQGQERDELWEEFLQVARTINWHEDAENYDNMNRLLSEVKQKYIITRKTS